MLKSLTFSKKILLSILSVVLLSSTIRTYFVTVESLSNAEQAAKKEIREISIANSLKIKYELEKSIMLSRNLASFLIAVSKNEIQDKKAIVEVMRSMSLNNPFISGLYVDLDENNFFRNNSNLKFSPYIHVAKEETSVSYDINLEKKHSWYKNSSKDVSVHIQEPYFSKIDGKDVLITSISIPLIIENVFLGAVGVDVPLTNIQKNIETDKIFDNGYGFLISENGFMIGHPQTKVLGKKIIDISTDANDKIAHEKIKANQEFSYEVLALSNKELSYNYIYPFEIGQSGTNWGFGISVPVDEYLANANSLKWFSIIAGILNILVITLVILYNTKILTRNLNLISNGLSSFFKYLDKEVATSEKIIIKANDEFGLMADKINENIEKIEKGLNKDHTCVKEVLSTVQSLKEGHITTHIKSTANNPELIKLSENFNEMIHILEQKIGKDLNDILKTLEDFSKYNFSSKIKNNEGDIEKAVNNLGLEVSNLLKEALTVGFTLESVSTKLLKNVDILNRNSNSTATSLEETAAALEEITSTITHNTENIVKVNSYTNELSESARKGQELANNTTTAMDEITEQVTLINEAISVIDQIAFQTNILSLNAAVEAATAGEAGKGFAVVAQEVRNLASRSAEAAKEIKELVENATSKASHGKAISADMIKGYEALLENIKGTSEMVDEISMASKEQQSGITQINDAIANLDSQTQENASIANQTQDIATQSTAIAKEIVENANEKQFIGKDEVKSK